MWSCQLVFSRSCFSDFTGYPFSLRSLVWGGLVANGAGWESLISSFFCWWKSPGTPSALNGLNWLKYPQYFPSDCFLSLKLPRCAFFLCDNICLLSWWLIWSAFLSPSSLTRLSIHPSLCLFSLSLVFVFVWMPWSCKKTLTPLWPLCVWQPDVWGRQPEVKLTTGRHVLNLYKDQGPFWLLQKFQLRIGLEW